MELLVFAVCERVIIDNQNNPSLIVLMENITIEFPAGVSVPERISLPREWFAFTMWTPAVDDIGKSFEQKFEFYLPAEQKPSFTTTLPFTISNEKPAKNVQLFRGFPVGKTMGAAYLQTWVEFNGSAVTRPVKYVLNLARKDVPQITAESQVQ